MALLLSGTIAWGADFTSEYESLSRVPVHKGADFTSENESPSRVPVHKGADPPPCSPGVVFS